MSETRSPIHITLPTHAALQSPIEVNTPASRSTIPPPPYVAFADPPPPSGAQSAPPEVPVTEVEASSGPLLQPPLPAHNVQDTIQPQPTIVSTQDRRTAFEQTGRPSPQIQTAQPGSIYWPPRADPPTLTLGQSYREKQYAQCAMGNHIPDTKFGTCGIITAICCFPIGLLCLCADSQKICTRCGEIVK